MSEEVPEEIKKKIFKMISTPGTDIEEIANEVNLEFDQVMEILSEEYLRSNLDYGRRLCCRF
jgi:tryptophanyl-tRNA synthetase